MKKAIFTMIAFCCLETTFATEPAVLADRYKRTLGILLSSAQDTFGIEEVLSMHFTKADKQEYKTKFNGKIYRAEFQHYTYGDTLIKKGIGILDNYVANEIDVWICTNIKTTEFYIELNTKDFETEKKVLELANLKELWVSSDDMKERHKDAWYATDFGDEFKLDIMTKRKEIKQE